jgi:hypothetical protein
MHNLTPSRQAPAGSDMMMHIIGGGESAAVSSRWQTAEKLWRVAIHLFEHGKMLAFIASPRACAMQA